jgi:hypothetical protein
MLIGIDTDNQLKVWNQSNSLNIEPIIAISLEDLDQDQEILNLITISPT